MWEIYKRRRRSRILWKRKNPSKHCWGKLKFWKPFIYIEYNIACFIKDLISLHNPLDFLNYSYFETFNWTRYSILFVFIKFFNQSKTISLYGNWFLWKWNKCFNGLLFICELLLASYFFRANKLLNQLN